MRPVRSCPQHVKSGLTLKYRSNNVLSAWGPSWLYTNFCVGSLLVYNYTKAGCGVRGVSWKKKLGADAHPSKTTWAYYHRAEMGLSKRALNYPSSVNNWCAIRCFARDSKKTLNYRFSAAKRLSKTTWTYCHHANEQISELTGIFHFFLRCRGA